MAPTQPAAPHGTPDGEQRRGSEHLSGAQLAADVTLSATETQIDAALATLSYQRALNFSGSDTSTVLPTDEWGNRFSRQRHRRHQR